MREDHRRSGILEDPDSVDLIEADVEVHSCLEDVVVPSDEPLMTVHPPDILEPTFVNGDVSEEIDMIFRSNDLIMPMDDHLIVVVDVSKDLTSNQLSIFVCKTKDIPVSEVVVTRYVYVSDDALSVR